LCTTQGLPSHANAIWAGVDPFCYLILADIRTDVLCRRPIPDQRRSPRFESVYQEQSVNPAESSILFCIFLRSYPVIESAAHTSQSLDCCCDGSSKQIEIVDLSQSSKCLS
jgi:hypothetical protein